MKNLEENKKANLQISEAIGEAYEAVRIMRWVYGVISKSVEISESNETEIAKPTPKKQEQSLFNMQTPKGDQNLLKQETQLCWIKLQERKSKDERRQRRSETFEATDIGAT